MSKNMTKKRKHVVFPFVLCLLVAIAVWLYASAKSEDEREEADVNKKIAAVEIQTSENAVRVYSI